MPQPTKLNILRIAAFADTRFYYACGHVDVDPVLIEKIMNRLQLQ